MSVTETGRGRGSLSRSGLRLIELVALPVVLLGLWWAATGNGGSAFFPPLPRILESFAPTWLGERLGRDVVPSSLRLLAGLAIAVVGGIAIGALIGAFRRVRAFCDPVIEFIRAVPPTVLLPILMLFVGIGPGLQITTIALGSVWPVLLNTVAGLRAVDPGIRDVIAAYRFRPLTRLTVALRSASPQIMAGVRQALSIAIILMVVSEMFASFDGVGYSIVQFQRGFLLTEMWTGILLLGAMGVVLALVFRIIERRVLRWYFRSRDLQRQE